MTSIALNKPIAAVRAGGNADMCHITDVVGAGYFLMLRFLSQAATPRLVRAEGCPGPILFCGSQAA
jgi:hypothetical protein